jgi:glucokinase
MSGTVIGVDLGGTQIRSVRASGLGAIAVRDSRWTVAEEGPDAVLRRIVESVRAVMGDEPPTAIGIGAPGPTDPHRGVVLMGPNLPGWNHVDLRRALQEPFGVPVYVGNDANLAGLAEYRYGAGRGVKHMIFITQSTGIGGGIIVDGRMLVGANGLAAEVGHMTIDLSQDVEADGIVGTLEGLAAGPDIAARAKQRLRTGAVSLSVDLAGGDIAAVTTKELGEAALSGDLFALEQFRETGVYLGAGVTNLLHVFNPQRIVLGGSVWMNCHAFMEASMWATIRQRAESPEYWEGLEICSAELGDDVGLLGAVALAAHGGEG